MKNISYRVINASKEKYMRLNKMYTVLQKNEENEGELLQQVVCYSTYIS
jgi:hypothetical protein